MKSDDELTNKKFTEALQTAMENLDALAVNTGPLIGFAATHMALARFAGEMPKELYLKAAEKGWEDAKDLRDIEKAFIEKAEANAGTHN